MPKDRRSTNGICQLLLRLETTFRRTARRWSQFGAEWVTRRWRSNPPQSDSLFRRQRSSLNLAPKRNGLWAMANFVF